MRLVTATGLAVAVVAASAGAASAEPACTDRQVTPRLSALIHAHRFADAHHAVVGLLALCGAPPAAESWRLLDDIALLRLEDREWALRDLHALAEHGAVAEPAAVVLDWAYTTDHDREAAEMIAARVPPPKAAAIAALGAIDDRDAFEHWAPRLSADLTPRARALWAQYDDAAHTKRPALAGVLSAVLPGAGQVYAGSLQGAAVTLVLNGLFIATTVEQSLRHNYATAAAAGTVASFFYIGGVINAVDLARRRNRTVAAPYRDELERLLVPEVDGAVP
jgi:hypothetical protein